MAAEQKEPPRPNPVESSLVEDRDTVVPPRQREPTSGRVDELPTRQNQADIAEATEVPSSKASSDTEAELYKPYPNGYHFPPKYTSGESFRHFMVGFWKYFTTPVGFLVVLYGLNVVAWGGMIFLLLVNAAPAMCAPSCDDIDSPRRVWVEWDAQILTALFSVTGFGLAPWRFRDMYYLLKFRIFGKHEALRHLAGVHRGWFRLQGSQDLPVDVGPGNIPDDINRDVIPLPERKIPDPPLTGVRAPPTKMWKLDFILWNNVWNTFFQAVLSGIMWGMNRYTRPSWATGLFVALACIVGAVGGLGEFFEGKNVKKIEGVALTDEDKEKLAHDKEQGIFHYNNLSAKKPKEKKGDLEAGTEKKTKRAKLGLGRKKEQQ